MTNSQALAELRTFWTGPLPLGPGAPAAIAPLAAEFGRPLPPQLTDYLTAAVPADDVDFTTVGNPLCLYGIGRLGVRQPGYSWNPVTNKEMADWPASYFLLGDEGGDPVLLDLAAPELGVQKLLHGAGRWEPGATVADSPAQLVLCAAALHHALTAFEDEPIIDDALGFNLAPQAAAWLFPNLKTWAEPYYAAWASAFDNA